MLEQIAHFNDFSPVLRKKLDEKIKSFGIQVKYRFKIGQPNPDPEKFNGKTIWPSRYTLDPKVFDIVDKDEKRDNKSRAKKVGIVIGVDEKGVPNKFGRVRVLNGNEGILTLDLDKPDDIAQAMFLELHPKVDGSLFQDKDQVPIISRIDERAEAQSNRDMRTARKNALLAVDKMSDDDVKQFSAAMKWDESEELTILRDKIEIMAEESPAFFLDLVKGEKVKCQALVKRALDKGVVLYDPVGGKFLWGANQEVIIVFGIGDVNKNEVEQFGEFLFTGGKRAEEVMKKIESLLKN